MKNLMPNEIDQVSGGNTVSDGLICAGSFGAMTLSDGLASVFLGAIAVGSCDNFVDDFGMGGGGGGGVGYDNGFMCMK